MKKRSRPALRIIALATALWLPLAQTPALAMSTSKEIAQGKAENAQIDAGSVVIKDPFLTSWVASITDKLVQYRIRKDIPYQFTIIQDESINAFAIKGGFVHVNMGLLNFVTSDDQLAATLGHEMGHVELHHVTKSDNTNAILAILEGILSIVSGPAAVLGSIGGELATDKFSRVDELQADHYGLGLMTKAGYDPHAAVDVMYGLGAQDPGPTGRADKAFLDHPVASDRVAHLLGYSELDRPAASALLARALHDQSEGRYSYAREMLAKAAASDPGPVLEEHKQQLNYALRDAGALAAPDSRVSAPSIPASDPQRAAATVALTVAEAAADASVKDVTKQAGAGNQDLNAIEQQLQSLSNIAGDGGGGPSGSGAQAALASLNRDLAAVGNLTSDVLSAAPGLVSGNKDALHDMAVPFQDPQPLTPMNASLLKYYPAMTANLAASTRALADSVAASRAALGQLQNTLIGMQSGAATNSDYGPNGQPASTPAPGGKRSPGIPPVLQQLAAAAAAAHETAAHASDEMYAAQTAQLSSQITMLDLFSSPERYEAYRAAVSYRFPGVTLPDYAAALASGIAPGDLGCASWYSLETQTPMRAAMEAYRSADSSCARLALDHHLLAESMEIAEGLLYEDYVETPLTKPAGT